MTRLWASFGFGLASGLAPRRRHGPGVAVRFFQCEPQGHAVLVPYAGGGRATAPEAAERLE